MRITHLKIRNFRGIAELDRAVPPAGAIIAGANGRGKTSTIKAIRAALAAQDIGPDAVRLGADKAEILVDLDDVHVRRVITAKTSTLAVTTRDGFKAPKPTAFLTELLGTSPLDPLDLFLSKPRDRRARILEALPVRVTRDQLRAWAPDLPPNFDVEGHGLEVVERARRAYYERRTVANAEAEAKAREAEAKEKEADEIVQTATLSFADDVTEDELRSGLEERRARLAELQARERAAREGAERTAATRDRIVGLRAEAEDRLRKAKAGPSAGAEDEARAQADGSRARVEQLAAQLRAAEAVSADTTQALAEVRSRRAEAAEHHTKASELQKTADDLAAAIAHGAPLPPRPDELDEASASVARARETLQAFGAWVAARAARARAEAAAEAARKAKAEAARLDAIVNALAKDAPRALMGQADTIPGLGLDGDDVTLDGVRLDGLCGAEQIRFSVEIAKRLNAKSKILVVDGLERLDPEQREAFVSEATSGGFQLLATCVDKGEPVFMALEADEDEDEEELLMPTEPAPEREVRA